MGNCFVSKIGNSNTSISDRSITTAPSTAGTSNNFSNGGGYSATSSSEGTCCDGEIWPTPCLKIYSFADLKRSTANFNSVLGIEQFGTVFKGWVDKKTLEPCEFGTGMIVAVRKFNLESLQTYKEWESEVNFLGRLSHPNLVKLLGYCWGDKELLIVYEFMQKGCLADHLFREKENPAIEPVSWDIRLKIVIGAARVLAFLHTSEKEIIHRDFNAYNILLDVNYNPKISNFCLARLGPSGGNSHVTTRVMGTYGYAAPEYVATGHLYVKSDVYSFGVVLLEMLSGLRVFDIRRPSDQQHLTRWAIPRLSHRKEWKTIMDGRIEGQYSSQAALQASNLSLRCLEREPKKRPSMKEVVEELEQIEAMKEEP